MCASDNTTKPFEDFSDAELCRAVVGGDAQALSVLLRRYSPIISAKAHSVFCHGLDSDDLFQEGMIVLLNAAVTYKEDKNTSFKTYALVCVVNRFRDLIRKSGGDPLTVSIDDAEQPCENDPEEQVMIRDELDRLRRIMDTVLSEKERLIILDHLSGLSYAQIAEKNGCDIKSVNNALCRVRKKLKQ